MIIDQLPLLSGDAQATDEFPLERGTTTYKVTLDRLLAALPKDATPTEDSINPVESGGVYDALQSVEEKSLPSGGTAGKVLSKASNTDYDTEWKSLPGLSWVDAWTNSDSSLTQSFEPQDVTANFGQYIMIEIQFKISSGYAARTNIIFTDGYVDYTATFTQTSNDVVTRRFTADNAKVSFQNCRRNLSGSWSVDNTSMVPMRIRGLKYG